MSKRYVSMSIPGQDPFSAIMTAVMGLKSAESKGTPDWSGVTIEHRKSVLGDETFVYVAGVDVND